MTQADEEARRRAEPARRVGLFRHQRHSGNRDRAGDRLPEHGGALKRYTPRNPGQPLSRNVGKNNVRVATDKRLIPD